MSRNLTCTPQGGTDMKEAVEEACSIAKALGTAGLYAFVMLKYNDISIGVNEFSDPRYTLKTLKAKIKKRYEHHNT